MTATLNGSAPARVDKEDVRRLAAGRWPEILSAVAGIPSELLDGRGHPCPKCGGDDRFSLVDADAGAVHCRHCLTSGNGDGYAAIAWMRGVEFPAAVALVAGHLGISAHTPSSSTPPRRPSDDEVLGAVCARKRMPVASAIAYGAQATTWGRDRVVEWPMYGPDGQQCSRFAIWVEPGNELENKGKNAKGQPAGLFLPHVDGIVRLPHTSERWHITEGCKDAASLHDLGLFAVGLPTASMNRKFAPLFRDVDVVIVPDRDPNNAGEQGATRTAKNFKGVARSVRVARLPIAEGDARDVLALPGGEKMLRDAIASSVVAMPATSRRLTGGRTEDDESGEPAEKFTDVGNAVRFSRSCGAKTRFVHPWKKWLIWDGTRWKTDDTDEVTRLAKVVGREIYLEAGVAKTKEAAKKLASWAQSSQSRQRIAAMLDLATSEHPIPITVESLDADPWVLNTASGTVCLRTGELRKHDPGDMITKSTGCEYASEPGDDSPLWASFLDSVFAGDSAMIEYVQRLMGSALVGAQIEHVLPILYGSGANGKSVFTSTILAALGEFGMVAPPGLLMVSRSERHPTEVADLHGRRLVIIAETKDGQKLDEGLVKSVTGGDVIRARRMREDFWEFRPSHTPIITTNHKPRVSGTDFGIWRRVRLIPFEVTIPIEKQDKNLTSKLANELPAILRWLVSGCIAWQRDGLQEPDKVMVATATYKQQSDLVALWLSECCEVGPGREAKCGHAYASFRVWCESAGEHPWSNRRYSERIGEQFSRSERTRMGYVYFGFSLEMNSGE